MENNAVISIRTNQELDGEQGQLLSIQSASMLSETIKYI